MMRTNDNKRIYRGKWVLFAKKLCVIINLDYINTLCKLLMYDPISNQIYEIYSHESYLYSIPTFKLANYSKDYLAILHSNKYHQFLSKFNLSSRTLTNKSLSYKYLNWLAYNEYK